MAGLCSVEESVARGGGEVGSSSCVETGGSSSGSEMGAVLQGAKVSMKGW